MVEKIYKVLPNKGPGKELWQVWLQYRYDDGTVRDIEYVYSCNSFREAQDVADDMNADNP